MGLTTDKNDPELHETGPNGQNKKYLVLSEEERAKGFVRPYRDAYVHVGMKVEDEGTIISLEEALEDGSEFATGYYTEENGYAAYLQYPKSESPLVGKYLKKDEYEAMGAGKSHVGGCGALTSMGKALSETYARDPKFYGSTFCVGCGTHLPVNEFIWNKTEDLVGS